MTSALGPPFPQPNEDVEGLTPPPGRLRVTDLTPDIWQPSEGDSLPTIICRIPATPPRIPREELPLFTAAIRIALREFLTQKNLPVEFGHEDVRNFSDCVLAHWSAALTQS